MSGDSVFPKDNGEELAKPVDWLAALNRVVDKRRAQGLSINETTVRQLAHEFAEHRRQVNEGEVRPGSLLAAVHRYVRYHDSQAGTA